MKKVLILSCILVLLFELSLMSQSYVYEVRIKGSKSWGYADLNGEVISGSSGSPAPGDWDGIYLKGTDENHQSR